MQPTGLKRRRIMSLGLLLGLAAMYFGYTKLQDFLQDPDTGVRDTRDLVLATKVGSDGAKAVLLSPGGSEELAPDATETSTDKAPVWRPDGNRVFFLSDRNEGAYLIHRWNVAKKSVEVRSIGTRSVTGMYWGPFGETDTKEALITQAGFVLSYEPREGTTRQVLPPQMKSANKDDEGGSTDQFQMQYQNIGKAFRSAKWPSDRSVVYALMTTEDDRQVLVRQGLQPEKDQTGELTLPRPQVLVVGKRVDYDVSGDGKVVACVLGFDFLNKDSIPEEFVKNGKIIKPYENAVIVFDFAGNAGAIPMAASKDPKSAFVSATFSPTGDQLLAIAGTWDGKSSFAGQAIVAAPVQANAQWQGVVQGNILEVAWHPSGQQMAFVQRVSPTESAVYTLKVGSDQPNKLTSGGEYQSISFSPQTEIPK
ncbi:MAG: PD40 domain-containing protein [Chthonomonas sp.]|nr:PD40 domain-containing protein [Chthonomonas sp.]